MTKIEQLIAIIEHFANGNKSVFAIKLGISPAAITNWVKRNTFDLELIANAFPSLNKTWLSTGEGEMLVRGGSSLDGQAVVGDNNTQVSGNDNKIESAKALLQTVNNALNEKSEMRKLLQEQAQNHRDQINKLISIIEKLTNKE